MTQRVFDVENEKDMQDLWDILPENVIAIKTENTLVYLIYNDNCCTNIPSKLFKIKWYGKDKITRPIQEVTKQDKGKLCAFWNENVEEYRIAIFTHTLDKFNNGYNFCDNTDTYWKHCRRLTRQEIEELC